MHATHRREPGREWEVYMYVSTVSAEIADGTLPEKRLSLRDLWHNVPFNVPFAQPIRRRQRTAAAGRTGRQAW